MGWMMGFEPTTLGTTIRCSNLLSYIHHKTYLYKLGSINRLQRSSQAQENQNIIFSPIVQTLMSRSFTVYADFEVFAAAHAHVLNSQFRAESKNRPADPKPDAAAGCDQVLQLRGVGMFQTDLETGAVLRASTTFCELLGYTEAELQGLSYAALTRSHTLGEGLPVRF